MKTNEASAINNDVDLVIISVRQASDQHTAAIEEAVMLYIPIKPSNQVKTSKLYHNLI